MKNVQKGLTFVELLVALALLSLVAASAVAAFSAGFRIWNRVAVLGARDQWVALAFFQLRQDLLNGRPFRPIGFSGEYDAFSFSAFADQEEPGRVSYFYDSVRRQLCRSRHPYRFLRANGIRDQYEVLLTDVERAEFVYHLPQAQADDSPWQSHWSSSELPLAVKIEVVVREPSQGQRKSYTLTVAIPAANVPTR